MEGAAYDDGVRMCCLLAIAIQAVADDELQNWIVTMLRGPADDGAWAEPQGGGGGHPLAASTRKMATRFATVLPPPLIPTARLAELLVNVQTNLFHAEEGRTCIALYPSAWLLEHACRPNAAVAVDPDGGAGGSIVVVATQPIAAGEAISFSYVADSGCYDDGELRPTAERRAEIEAQCGFVCRCAACEPSVVT